MIPKPSYKVLAVKNVWGCIKDPPDLLEYFQEIGEDELPDS